MIRLKHHIFLCIVLCILILATGCALAKGYRGPIKDRSQLAVVRAHGVTIHQINDIEIGSTSSGVLVPAGENRVYLTVNASNYNNPEDSLELKELELRLEGNTEYLISSQRGVGPLCAWPVSQVSRTPDYQNPAGCL